MQVGMIGLGRMGGNMVRRLTGAGHDCVVFDRSPEAVAALAKEGAAGATSLDDFVKRLAPPRVVWMMIPAALVDEVVGALAGRLASGDIIVDGGNSYYVDDIQRSKDLASRGIDFVDVGTSGGLWGLERGYCLMVGGAPRAVEALEPILAALAPAIESV
ncbi:MAG: NAD(P)-binding domain-containing protein, partial [Candidatus Eiseniibacteriota bacterium]